MDSSPCVNTRLVSHQCSDDELLSRIEAAIKASRRRTVYLYQMLDKVIQVEPSSFYGASGTAAEYGPTKAPE